MHIQQEEEKLFPYCERCQGWGRAGTVDSVLKEHLEIQSLIAELEHILRKGQELVPISSALSELLDQHVRHEERVVFEQIQEVLTERELERLGKYLKT